MVEPRSLPLSFVQESVRSQIEVSKEILDAAARLEELKGREHDDEWRRELDSIIEQLVTSGSRIANNASKTGQTVANLVKAA